MTARSSYKSPEEGFRVLAGIINGILKGRHGEVTITASVATTTVNDARIGINSQIFLQAKTATAATELATAYISNITNEQFTITHANSAVVDRIFSYKIEG